MRSGYWRAARAADIFRATSCVTTIDGALDRSVSTSSFESLRPICCSMNGSIDSNGGTWRIARPAGFGRFESSPKGPTSFSRKGSGDAGMLTSTRERTHLPRRRTSDAIALSEYTDAGAASEDGALSEEGEARSSGTSNPGIARQDATIQVSTASPREVDWFDAEGANACTLKNGIGPLRKEELSCSAGRTVHSAIEPVGFE